MFQQTFFFLYIFYILSFSNLSAETLKQAVIEAINTNPALKEKLRDYRASQQNLKIVESEYYPTIDLSASYGTNSSSGLVDNLDLEKDKYSNYNVRLELTQNLFNGFASVEKVEYEEMKILVSAYKFMEKSNELTFSIAKAYLDILRYKELLKISVKNVQINETTYKMIENLFESGSITLSEIKKIESTLAYSKSNLVMALTKARNAKFHYRRIVGRMPNLSEMRKPDYRIKIPRTSQSASLYAINYNPSLLVNRYTIKSFQALRKENKKGFYPTLDLKLTQNYNDSSELNIYDTPDDRFQARLVLNYNIFRGGADSAKTQKYISLTDREIEKGRDLKRKIIEDVDIAWSSYDMTKAQLKNLREYKISSEEAFNLYQEEFNQGTRSLLELLLAQHDTIEAETALINTEYDSLLSKYSILNATGLLFVRIVKNIDFASQVNLFTDNKVHTILDTDLVKLDVDSDNISDNQDLCDNSILENNIMPYGCKKINKFSSNMKELIKYKQQNKIQQVVKKEKKRVKVLKPKLKPKPIVKKKERKKLVKKKKKKKVKKKEFIKTSFIEENSISRPDIYTKNGLDDENFYGSIAMYGSGGLEKGNKEDKPEGCFDVPAEYILDDKGCAVSTMISLSNNFEKVNKSIPKSIYRKIKDLAFFLNANPSLSANIVGYSSRTAVSSYKYNLKISKERAERFKNELVKLGVFSYRLTTDGKGYRDPIANNNTKAGRNINRRVEVTFSR